MTMLLGMTGWNAIDISADVTLFHSVVLESTLVQLPCTGL